MKNSLSTQRILVGITGGIAAYKAAELVRFLKERGHDVRVVMTEAAKEFITPLTLQALSGHPVYSDLFARTQSAAMDHIELARWPQLVVIAPASANFIARMAQGYADDLLATICLATQAPICVAPAMNQQMWRHPAVQSNLQLLKERGVTIIGPACGAQACGEFGLGRMMEPAEIIAALTDRENSGALSGQTILITAGPTQEAIDPVRYLSNHSSGKMGYALAQAAATAGAKVILVSGPTQLACPANVERINVLTAEEMLQVVMQHLPSCAIFIGAAAVADYRMKNPFSQKLKKGKGKLVLELEENSDILSIVTAQKSPPLTVGFAAETENMISHAKSKLMNKNLDMIVANNVGNGKGFGADQNEVVVITQSGVEKTLPLAPKIQIAKQLIEFIAHYQTSRMLACPIKEK